MRKLKYWLMAVFMAAGVVSAVPTTAFAYAADPAQTEASAQPAADGESGVVIQEQAENSGQTEEDSQNENQGNSNETPFSVPGNGELLDDKKEDESKEFLTIQTKNGNTFFLILDRSSNTENVYMLSMIDENDLAEFVDETKTEEEPEVVIPETTPEESTIEPETEVKNPQENRGMNLGAMAAIGILAAAGIGAGYYLKVVKPKKEEDEEDAEDLEFYDGGAYVNEDQQEDSQQEAEEESPDGEEETTE
ncbi:DUF4366 domain-containing protein [Enterocloster clostridioformis]|uniref:CD1107 family mobile element protein n=1 Tax=Enterocloster clostridioformis TaxID=1531 RepID=UPI0026757263|nr:DUF4366 domain-containing protein [Enterocloster clostridioformis]